MRHHLAIWLTRERLLELWRVARLAARDFLKDNGPTWAAAIAYYSLLSIFPLLLAVGSIAAFFIDPQWAVHQAIVRLGNFLPREPALIEKTVRSALEAGRGSGLLAILPLLWTGSLVFGALTRALNVVYDAEETGSFGRRLLARLLMLLTLGVLFLLALAAPLALRALQALFGFLPIGSEFLYQLVVNLLPAAVLLFALFLIYRRVPRRRTDWRAPFAGAVVATLLFVTAKPLFLAYLNQLSRHNVVYGSLAGTIAVVLWAWLVAMMVLFGGQLSLHCQLVFAEGRPVEEIEREHLDRTERERRARARSA